MLLWSFAIIYSNLTLIFEVHLSYCICAAVYKFDLFPDCNENGQRLDLFIKQNGF